MFEKEISDIRILSNAADAQWLTFARDLLRKAEYEFRKRNETRIELDATEVAADYHRDHEDNWRGD